MNRFARTADRFGLRRNITGMTSGGALLSKGCWFFRGHWWCGLSVILRAFGKIASLLSEVGFLNLVSLCLAVQLSLISFGLLVDCDVISYIDACLSVVPGCSPCCLRV